MNNKEKLMRFLGIKLSPGRKNGELWVWVRPYMRELSCFFVLLMLCTVVTIFNPVFIRIGNLMNVARQISIIGTIAAGQTFVILIGGIDLSVGSIAAIGSIVVSDLVANKGVHFPLAMLLGFLVAGAFGVANGVLVGKAKLPPFIVTLGMMNIARGVTHLWTGGRQVSGFPPAFTYLGKGMVGVIPVPVIIMFIVYIVCYFVLMRTKFGIHLYAIGGNAEAARVSGVKIYTCIIMVYLISGLLSGLGGIMLAGRLNSGQPAAGIGYELDTIAAATIGGASLMGGKVNLWGTFIGVFIIGVLRNGLNLLNISTFWQQVAIGLVIIVAVYLDTVQKQRLVR